MRSKIAGPASSDGFSLVELTLLLGMMVVIMAISIPTLSNSLRDMQLAADARNIAAALASARMSAIAQMTHCRVSFDLQKNSWWVEKLNRSTGEFELQQAAYSLSEGVANSGIAFEDDSPFAPSGFPTASSTSITFNSRGIPIDSAGVPTASSIVYLKKGDSLFAISVSLSGKIQLWKMEGGQWVAR